MATVGPMIDCQTERQNEFPVTLRVRAHTFRADVMPDSGSTDSAPGPHDYFDAALAACKALTATWYARKNKIALERVETHVEHDDSEERNGKYVLKSSTVTFGANPDILNGGSGMDWFWANVAIDTITGLQTGEQIN